MAETLERLYYNLIRRLKRKNRNLKLIIALIAVLSATLLIISAARLKSHR